MTFVSESRARAMLKSELKPEAQTLATSHLVSL